MRILRGPSEVKTIVAATEAYDLFVIAARPHNTLSNIFFKTIEDHLAQHAVCSVLLLKSPRVGPRVLPQRHRPLNLANYLQPSLVDRQNQVADKEELFRLCAQRFSLEVPHLSNEDIFRARTNEPTNN